MRKTGKSLPLDLKEYSIKKSEYFIFDITLNDLGGISNIDVLRRDSSYNITKIRPAASVIKKMWKPIKSNYSKVFIPIILTFEELDKDGELTDENGIFSINYFFQYLKNNNKHFYVSDRIYIHFYEPRK